MEGKEEDVSFGEKKFAVRQPLGTAVQTYEDYKEPPSMPLLSGELKSWSFYKAGITGFITTFLLLYITSLIILGYSRNPNKSATVSFQGIAWDFGGMIFALLYSTVGISERKQEKDKSKGKKKEKEEEEWKRRMVLCSPWFTPTYFHS